MIYSYFPPQYNEGKKYLNDDEYMDMAEKLSEKIRKSRKNKTAKIEKWGDPNVHLYNIKQTENGISISGGYIFVNRELIISAIQYLKSNSFINFVISGKLRDHYEVISIGARNGKESKEINFIGRNHSRGISYFEIIHKINNPNTNNALTDDEIINFLNNK